MMLMESPTLADPTMVIASVGRGVPKITYGGGTVYLGDTQRIPADILRTLVRFRTSIRSWHMKPSILARRISGNHQAVGQNPIHA